MCPQQGYPNFSITYSCLTKSHEALRCDRWECLHARVPRNPKSVTCDVPDAAGYTGNYEESLGSFFRWAPKVEHVGFRAKGLG